MGHLKSDLLNQFLPILYLQSGVKLSVLEEILNFINSSNIVGVKFFIAQCRWDSNPKNLIYNNTPTDIFNEFLNYNTNALFHQLRHPQLVSKYLIDCNGSFIELCILNGFTHDCYLYGNKKLPNLLISGNDFLGKNLEQYINLNTYLTIIHFEDLIGFNPITFKKEEDIFTSSMFNELTPKLVINANDLVHLVKTKNSLIIDNFNINFRNSSNSSLSNLRTACFNQSLKKLLK